MTNINRKLLAAALCMLSAALPFYAEGGKRQEVVIIYGGGSHGPLVPYPPSDEALGGLSRYAGTVNALRRAHKAHFAVDAGNMASAANAEHRVPVAAAYYDRMNFDAIAPGGGELTVGLAEFAAAQRSARPFAASNIIMPEGSGIPKYLLLSKRGYDLYFINVLCPSVIPHDKVTQHDPDPRNLQALLRSPEAAKAHVRAAVVHGSMDEITALAAALPELDVIIAGSLPSRIAPTTVGKTHIVSAGAGNKFAGLFTVRFDSAKKITSVYNKLYPIFQDAAPDKTVERIVRPASAAVKKRMLDTVYHAYHKPAPVSGVIPFVSARAEGVKALLKAAENRREYALSSGEPSPRKPILSASGNRAAFIYGEEGAMNGKLRMVDLAAMEARTVASGRNVIDAAFSPPDGFLYYIEADSGNAAGAIYKTKMYMYDAFAVIGRDGAPRRDLSVSDDGSSLLWSSLIEGKWHICVSDTAAGARPARLTSANADHRLPRMSPDSRYVAYLSDRNNFGGKMDLWVFDRKRISHTQLTRHSNTRDFCWRDDSKTIYFSSGVNITDINSVRIRNRKIVIQRASATLGPKTWSESAPRFIRFKDAPKIVYTREYIDGRKRLHWIDVKTRTDEAIFTLGDRDEWNE